ncbi:hypothetical protein Tco_1249284 [Tanacetum coccineum]
MASHILSCMTCTHSLSIFHLQFQSIANELLSFMIQKSSVLRRSYSYSHGCCLSGTAGESLLQEQLGVVINHVECKDFKNALPIGGRSLEPAAIMLLCI